MGAPLKIPTSFIASEWKKPAPCVLRFSGKTPEIYPTPSEKKNELFFFFFFNLFIIFFFLATTLFIHSFFIMNATGFRVKLDSNRAICEKRKKKKEYASEFTKSSIFTCQNRGKLMCLLFYWSIVRLWQFWLPPHFLLFRILLFKSSFLKCWCISFYYNAKRQWWIGIFIALCKGGNISFVCRGKKKAHLKTVEMRYN